MRTATIASLIAIVLCGFVLKWVYSETPQPITQIPQPTVQQTKQTVEPQNDIEIAADDIEMGYIDISNISLEHGKLESIIRNDDIYVVKAFAEPSLTNKLTIDQHFFNVYHLLREYELPGVIELQYWAICDTLDGKSIKYISFTVPHNVIELIREKDLPAPELKGIVQDLWIAPQLLEDNK